MNELSPRMINPHITQNQCVEQIWFGLGLVDSVFMVVLFFVFGNNKRRSLCRYDEDIHDRTWVPFIKDNTTSISTDLTVDTSNPYDVPQLVAKTAMIPADPTQPLNIRWTFSEISAQSYVYMHFAEIQNLEANEIREFNVTFNGLPWLSFFSPLKLGVSTVFTPTALSSPDGTFSFTFTMTSSSTLPPLINGLEIYKVLEI